MATSTKQATIVAHTRRELPEAPLLSTLDQQLISDRSRASDTTPDRIEQHTNNIVDGWDSEDNEDNPRNWSILSKWTIIALVSFVELLTHMTSMMFAPTIPEMQKDFNSPNNTLATFSMTIYVLGFGVGPLLFAPLSEVYGRVIIYRSCLFMFLVMSIACAVSTSMSMLVGFRFIAGCFGASPVAIGGAVVGDLFRFDGRGTAMSVYMSGPIIANLVGPPFGGLVAQYKGWRWVFWIISIVTAFTLVTSLILLKETHPQTIASRLQTRTNGDSTVPHKADDDDKRPTLRFKLTQNLSRPLKLLTLSPIVTASSLLIAMVVGTMNLLLATIARVFQEYYQFSPTSAGLVYLGLTIGFVFAAIVFAATSDKVLKVLTKRHHGKREPEFRLPAMMAAMPIIVIGLFWYGWSTQMKSLWIVPVISLNIIGVGITTVQLSLSTYLIDSFDDFSASALAAVTLTRSLGGALVPIAGPKLYQRFGLGWGNSMLAFLNLSFCLIPILLYIFGARWRDMKTWNGGNG